MPTKEAPQYIIDASVAVKWFSEEEKSSCAREILKDNELGKIRLFAPDLLLCELGNALGRGKQLEAKDIAEAFHLLFASSIEFLRLTEKLAVRTADFMERYSLTFYDASYGALAHELDIPLLSENPKDHGSIKEITIKSLDSFKKA